MAKVAYLKPNCFVCSSTMLFYLCLLIAFGVLQSSGQVVPHNCPLVTANELGSSDAHTDRGIIANALRALGDASDRQPSLQIYDHQVTCTVAGTATNTFQFLSVVVFFSCADQSGFGRCENFPMLSGPANYTMQFELHCASVDTSTPE